MRYIVGRVALIRRYRATFSQWEKAPSTVFKIYLGQLWSVTTSVLNTAISSPETQAGCGSGRSSKTETCLS